MGCKVNAWVLGGAVCAAAAPAAAAEVYSTFGPGDSYSASMFIVGNWTTIGPEHWAIAAAFSSPAAFTLESFDLAVNSFQGQQIRFAVHGDSGGLPGSILQSVTLPVTQVEPGIINVDFASLDLGLAANTTYHFSLTDPNPTVNALGGWNVNDQGATGLSASPDSGGTWGSNPGATPAFRVNGVVPEPGTAAALLGVLATAACRRRGWRSAD